MYMPITWKHDIIHKTEIRNILHLNCRWRRIKPQLQVTCRPEYNFAEVWTCGLWNKTADGHTDTLIATLETSNGGEVKTQLLIYDQWRFHAGAGGHSPPKSWLGPTFSRPSKLSRTLDTLWSVVSQKKIVNLMPQMSDFNAKMHKIRFPPGLRPRHPGGAYSTPQSP